MSMRKSLVISKTALIQYIYIYIFLLFTGAMGFRNYSNLFIIVGVFLGLWVLFIHRRRVPQHYVFFLVVLTIALFFEIFFTDGGVGLSSIVSILSRYLIILAAYYYDEINFCERFVKLSIWLAVISICGFALLQIAPSLLKSVLPTSTEIVSTYWGDTTATYYGNFIFAFSEDAARNMGIYHEPGLYEIVLNATLYMLLFKKNHLALTEKKWNIYIVIIVITILTTMSTTGYIVTAALFVIYFLFSGEKLTRIKMKRRIGAIALALLALLTFNDFIFGSDGLLETAVFSKITNSSGQLDFTVSTGQSRIVSLLADLQVFFENPLGIGYTNYNDTWSSNLIDETISDVSSCVGLTQILAILGIIVTVIIIGYYIYLSVINQNKIEKLAFWIFFLNVTLSQPQIWYPALVVLLLINDSDKTSETDEGINLTVDNYFY